MHNLIESSSIVIASGGTTSAAFELEAWPIAALLVPTIDSATLKLQGSQDGSTWFDLYDGDGTQVCFWAASTGNRAMVCDGAGAGTTFRALTGFKYGRIVLGAIQTADRTFTLIKKDPVY